MYTCRSSGENDDRRPDLDLVISSFGVEIHGPRKVHEGEMGVAQFLVDFAHEEVNETFAGDEFLQLLQLLQRLQVPIRREEDGCFVELA